MVPAYTHTCGQLSTLLTAANLTVLQDTHTLLPDIQLIMAMARSLLSITALSLLFLHFHVCIMLHSLCLSSVSATQSWTWLQQT